jgi:hypothetical protein
MVQYSASNPCKLKALATSVADTLEHQRFAPDLLSRLCKYALKMPYVQISDREVGTSGFFRDHLLQLRPSLLDLLIRKAANGHNEVGARTCMDCIIEC